LQTRRPEFKPEREVKNEITGEERAIFPWKKRLFRQLLQIPFALLAASALGAVIATGFAIEISFWHTTRVKNQVLRPNHGMIPSQLKTWIA
jgi:Calcium-activated chloride channel